MLLVCAVLVLCYLLYILAFKPLSQSVETLARQNSVAEQTLAEVKQLAEKYRQFEGAKSKNNSASSGSLTRIVNQTVKKNTLDMSRFQPSSSGDVQVRFENSSFSSLLAWLNDLEGEYDVLIKDISISPGSGSGLVNVSVRLAK